MFINQHDQQNTFLKCIKLFLTWSTNSEPNYLAEKNHCVTFLLRNSRTRDAAITSVYEGSIFASQTFNSWRRQQAPAMSMWFLFLNHKLVGARHIETFQSSNTTLARFSIRGGAHLIRYPTNFQASAIRIRKCGDGMGGGVIIWAMDISSISIGKRRNLLRFPLY